MELLETAYPEATLARPDARPLLRAALDDALETDTQEEKSAAAVECLLASSTSGIPLLSFSCPISTNARLRIRLPRRYPETPLEGTVEGTPHLTATARAAISAAAASEASRLSGPDRHEPHCLQVLGEATRALADSADNVQPERSSPACDAVAGARGVNAEGGGPRVAHDSESDSRRPGPLDKPGASAHPGPRNQEAVGTPPSLGRRLIYSHHIIASQKRTGIVKTARELMLGGFSKVGQSVKPVRNALLRQPYRWRLYQAGAVVISVVFPTTLKHVWMSVSCLSATDSNPTGCALSSTVRQRRRGGRLIHEHNGLCT